MKSELTRDNEDDDIEESKAGLITNAKGGKDKIVRA